MTIKRIKVRVIPKPKPLPINKWVYIPERGAYIQRRSDGTLRMAPANADMSRSRYRTEWSEVDPQMLPDRMKERVRASGLIV